MEHDRFDLCFSQSDWNVKTNKQFGVNIQFIQYGWKYVLTAISKLLSRSFNIFTATGWICHKPGSNVISVDPCVLRMKHAVFLQSVYKHCDAAIDYTEMLNYLKHDIKNIFKRKKIWTTRKSVLSVSREASKCLTDSTAFGWLTCHVSSLAFQLLCAALEKKNWLAICETVPVLWIHTEGWKKKEMEEWAVISSSVSTQQGQWKKGEYEDEGWLVNKVKRNEVGGGGWWEGRVWDVGNKDKAGWHIFVHRRPLVVLQLAF